MKNQTPYLQLMAVAGISFIASQSCSGPRDRQLVFPDHPDMKIGFSTQNFMEAFSFSAESIHELMLYACEEGYQFIELRDNMAELSVEECRALAEAADQAGIEVIYEINVNLLHPDFKTVFERGLVNTLEFKSPGILRATIALSEFSDDPSKVGWTMKELTDAAVMADQCASMANEQGITFIVENMVEPFIGNAPHYYGLSDLYKHTRIVGLQYDLCNPFAFNSRKQATPAEVADLIGSLGGRWVTTHVKTSVDGIPQPVLGDSPLSIEEVTALMGKAGVTYFALEMTAAETKEACFKNHARSINYLIDLGILKKESSK